MIFGIISKVDTTLYTYKHTKHTHIQFKPLTLYHQLLGRKPIFPGQNADHQVKLMVASLGPLREAHIKKCRHETTRAFLESLAKSKKTHPLDKMFSMAFFTPTDLMIKLLTYDPDDRFAVEQALKHQYMKSTDKVLLHDARYEPVREALPAEDFLFELQDNLVSEALHEVQRKGEKPIPTSDPVEILLRELVMEEVLFYNPDLQDKVDLSVTRELPAIPAVVEEIRSRSSSPGLAYTKSSLLGSVMQETVLPPSAVATGEVSSKQVCGDFATVSEEMDSDFIPMTADTGTFSGDFNSSDFFSGGFSGGFSGQVSGGVSGQDFGTHSPLLFYMDKHLQGDGVNTFSPMFET